MFDIQKHDASLRWRELTLPIDSQQVTLSSCRLSCSAQQSVSHIGLPWIRLFSLSGGLAAPALAAVAGTAMTTVGGASAAAAVTGIMGSSVGAAAVIAGFGAGGAHVVGGKMAKRIGALINFSKYYIFNVFRFLKLIAQLQCFQVLKDVLCGCMGNAVSPFA